jgi:Fungal Zn(2)-Cys(6) binuclear cluster domain
MVQDCSKLIIIFFEIFCPPKIDTTTQIDWYHKTVTDCVHSVAAHAMVENLMDANNTYSSYSHQQASIMQDDAKEDPHEHQLCASCDRCRARKTKCDGKRPCSNCAVKYMKKNKLTRFVCIEIVFRYFCCAELYINFLMFIYPSHFTCPSTIGLLFDQY